MTPSSGIWSSAGKNRARIIEADRIERAVKSEQRSARMAEKAERQATRTAELPTRAAQSDAEAQQTEALRREKLQGKERDAAVRVQKKPNSRPPINANWPNMKPA